MAKTNDARNVLVSRFSAIGDIALTIPVLYEACSANPDKRFFLLTRSMAASIFVNHPENLTVIGVNLDDYKGVRGMARLARQLKKEYGIDTYLDLHDVLRTKLLRFFMRMSGVKTYTIDKGRKEKAALTRSNDKVLLPLKSTTTRYADVFEHAGMPVEGTFRSVFQKKEADPALFASVAAPKKKGEKWIGVAPFAKHKGKIYPLDLMEKVIAGLEEKGYSRIFIFGAGKEETSEIDRIASKYPDTVNMAKARLGFAAELALQNFCDAVISMDSANMHLASVAGTRVISVWGATHPFCGFTGWGQNPKDCVELDMVCRPCSVFGNKPCARGDYHCLKGISPQMILSRLE